MKVGCPEQERAHLAVRALHKSITLYTIAVLAGASLSWLSSAQGAVVKNVRIKPLPDRTEVVLDLDAPLQQCDLNGAQSAQRVIEFDGQMTPGQLKQFSQSFSDRPNLKSLNWQATENKIKLTVQGKAPAPVKVYQLENPHRLVISLEELASTKQSKTIAPGVVHHHLIKASRRGPLNINVLEIDPQNPQVQIEPVLANTMLHGKARVANLVQRHDAVAGINAAFFKPDSGTTLGMVILNKELIAGPIYDRVALGLGADKTFEMSRMSLKGQLTNQAGTPIAITTVNQPRLSKHDSILYSSRWGQLAPPCARENIAIQIDGYNRVVAVGYGRYGIPQNGYVLITPVNTDSLALRPGDDITLNVYTTPDWSNMSHALSGGPYLVKDGNIYVDATAQHFRGGLLSPAPRTAVGFTAKNKLLMVTVDGRQNKSVGLTLSEMAKLMKDLGAVQAMNFDGGSSTQMVVQGRIVNSPTVAKGAAVGSALVVRSVPSNVATTVDKEVIGITPLEPNKVP